MKSFIAILGITLSASSFAQTDFFNLTTVRIPGVGTGATSGSPAGSYPLGFSVAGMGATTSDVNITLQFGSSASTGAIAVGQEHSSSDDLDIMLVSPLGTTLVFLSDAGSSWDMNGAYTFDDEAASAIDINGSGQNDGISNLLNGLYRSSNYGAGDTFVAPAPTPVFTNITFSVFDGVDPNGLWLLYISDDEESDAGWLMNSTLTVTAVPEPATMVALGLGTAALMRRRRK